jgi:hypothetical protein
VIVARFELQESRELWNLADSRRPARVSRTTGPTTTIDPWFHEKKRRLRASGPGTGDAFIRAFRPRLKRSRRTSWPATRGRRVTHAEFYRDTRFARGASLTRRMSGSSFARAGARAPRAEFYVHIEPGECFLAAGLWRPDPVALGQVRQAIIARPTAGRTGDGNRGFANDSLWMRLPQASARGFPADHPLSKISMGRTSSGLNR